jgi:hypothetical protein
MSKITYFKQCHLSKKIDTGEMKQTSWIPEEFAKLNKVIKLRDENGTWVNGWVVRQVGQSRLAENELPNYHKEIKEHRKTTGDSKQRK